MQVRTRTRISWMNMKSRCLCKTNPRYEKYGGRGIKVCDQWLKFDNFLNDMGECPDGYSIERIDVNGHYEPSNCKWIPLHHQGKNRRKSFFLTAFGKTQTLMEWSVETGLTYKVLFTRHKNGWPVHMVLSVPPNHGNRIKRLMPSPD